MNITLARMHCHEYAYLCAGLLPDSQIQVEETRNGYAARWVLPRITVEFDIYNRGMVTTLRSYFSQSGSIPTDPVEALQWSFMVSQLAVIARSFNVLYDGTIVEV